MGQRTPAHRGAYSLAVAGGFAINRLHAGWQEDGLLGMIWTWKHPVGWEFMGERRSPLIALWLILAVLSVLTASAINKTWP